MNNNIYCSLDPKCKNPIGPTVEGTNVQFRIRIDKISKIVAPKLIIFRIDDWENREEINLYLSEIETTYNYYSCSYVPNIADVYFYYFSMQLNDQYVELRRGKYANGIFADQTNECFQLTVYTKNMFVPKFMKGAIFYQIFPDRFCNSGIAKENVPADRKLHTNWYENPDHLPNLEGVILNDDYFGGDLKGITEKLDYIQSLGVTILYLNPIFEAHSNHRYNTADYLKVDPLLGTEEDFKELCLQAKERGIRIILDGVFNHTGSDSIYFNKNNRYNTIGAYNSMDSEYFSWFHFYQHPDVYDSWWNFDTLPKLNKHSKKCLEFISMVVKKWIHLGASGFRLDVVDELPNSMLAFISSSIKEETIFGERASIIGEVWEDVSTKEAYGERKHYFTQNTLDSAMNYVFKDALFHFFETKDAENFLDTILRIIENYPKDNLDAMMNIISGHDIERALTRLIKEPISGRNRYWQAENDYMDENSYHNGKHLLKLLSVLQYFLPGNPCLYYGDEAGVYGYADPFNRKTYPWKKEDQDLIAFYKMLGNIKTSSPYLGEALFVPILFHEGICVFSRKSLNSMEQIYVGVNLSDHAIDLHFLGAKNVLYSSMGTNEMNLLPYQAIILN